MKFWQRGQKRSLVVAASATIVVQGGVAASGVFGQCQFEWDRQFGHSSAGAPQYFSTAVYDDGTGPALYVGSASANFDGTYSPSGLFRFDAANGQWLSVTDGALFGGYTGYGLTLTVWDQDGAGPQQPVLVIAGPGLDFGVSTNVMTWDGATFTSLPPLDKDFHVLQDHTAGLEAADLDHDGIDELYIFGSVQSVDGAWGVARYDPATLSWRSLDFRWPAGSIDPQSSLIFDDGSGPALFISGRMDDGIGGVAGTRHVAKWNGTNWVGSATELPLFEPTGKLVAYDADGAGPGPARLVTFSGSNVWVWDGTSWTSFAYPGPGGCVPPRAAAVVDEATGPVVYFGSVSCTGTGTRLYRFDGTSVTETPSSLVQGMPIDNVSFLSYLGTHDLGGGDQLIAAGYMVAPGTQAGDFVAWSGTAWTDAGASVPAQHRPQSILDGVVADTDGAGPSPRKLWVCGGAPELVGAWDGTAWQTFNTGLPVDPFPAGGNVRGLSIAASRAGAVYVSVQDNSIPAARVYQLNGSGWSSLSGAAGGFDGENAALLVADVGAADQLYAYGRFRHFDGSPLAGIAHYNGTSWEPLSSGLTPTPVPSGLENSWFGVSAAAFNDGTGMKLFVSGIFTDAGGVTCPAGLATWNGSAWADAGAGLAIIGSVSTFHAPGYYKLFTGGGGLFAVPANYADGTSIYRWNGGGWTVVGAVPANVMIYSGEPTILGSADIGQGDHVYFVDAFNLHSFDPATFAWTDRTTELGLLSLNQGSAAKVLRFDVDNQTGMCMLGGFTGVGGTAVGGDPASGVAGVSVIASPGIARWFCPTPSCPADFNNSGVVSVQDIFDFLAAYFAADPRADFNHSGAVSVQDIFDYLAAYFAGCT